MKYKVTTTATTRTTTRAEVLRSLKDTVFNVRMFDDMSAGNNSYIYIIYNDDPDHILVIQRDPETETLEEFKALKVGDVASIQEFWGCTGDVCTIEVNHTFSRKGCESVTIERYREEISEDEPQNAANNDIIESRINFADTQSDNQTTTEADEVPTFDNFPIIDKVRRFAQKVGKACKVQALKAGNALINAFLPVVLFLALVCFIYLHVVGAAVDCVGDCWRNGSALWAAVAVLMLYGGPLFLAVTAFYIYKDSNIYRRLVANMFM